MQECISNDKSHIHVPHPQDLEMRPIVAGPACATHRLSNFCDILLKPFVPKIKSHIRDTNDFLGKLPTQVEEDSFLVTFDVKNLYGSIPHDLGLEAITFWLDKHPELTQSRFSKDFILDSIKIILENNVFHFDGQYYQQMKGTAMGTKLGPTYATLVMGYLELKLYEKMKEDYGESVADKFIQLWKRFLDDCFIIWNTRDCSLEDLLTRLNSLHSSLIFTMNASREKLPFLDVLVMKNRCKISTDIYHKPTDSKNYLLYSSHHPRHTKINLPYNLALRIVTIVSENSLKRQRLLQLESDLLKRQYPLAVIKKGIEKALSMKREELLKPKCKEPDNKILPIVTTYNSHNTNFFNIVNGSISSLKNDRVFKSILPNLKLINSKRQPPRLSNLLMRAKFLSNESHKYIVSKCGRGNCGTCSVILEGSEYIMKSTGVKVKLKEDMDCRATYVIYVIKCLGCGEDYSGCTNNLRKRVTIHKQHIRQPQYEQCPVTSHLRKCSGGQFKIFPFFRTHTDNNPDLYATERRFIKQLKPKLNGI